MSKIGVEFGIPKPEADDVAKIILDLVVGDQEPVAFTTEYVDGMTVRAGFERDTILKARLTYVDASGNTGMFTDFQELVIVDTFGPNQPVGFTFSTFNEVPDDYQIQVVLPELQPEPEEEEGGNEEEQPVDENTDEPVDENTEGSEDESSDEDENLAGV